jgi:hypothetical protein
MFSPRPLGSFVCARDIAGTSRRRRPRRRRWPIDGLVLMGAAATLRHCSPSESGPAAMPTSPFLEGLSGRVRIPAPAATRSRRVFDGLRARVFFFVGRTLDASRAIAPPGPPFLWFFGLRLQR